VLLQDEWQLQGPWPLAWPGACACAYLRRPFQRAARRAQVLRSHRETLVSVLETFVHDPLCEWAQAGGRSREREEGANPMARDALATIDGALVAHANGPCGEVWRGPQQTQYRDSIMACMV